MLTQFAPSSTASAICSAPPREVIQNPSWCADALLNQEMKLDIYGAIEFLSA